MKVNRREIIYRVYVFRFIKIHVEEAMFHLVYIRVLDGLDVPTAPRLLSTKLYQTKKEVDLVRDHGYSSR